MSSEATKRTVVELDCPDCEETDVTSVLEHPRDSPQTEAVAQATHQVAEEHEKETGHVAEVEIKERRAN